MDIGSYVELAREARPALLEQIKSFLKTSPNAVLKDDQEGEKTGYYSLSDMDRLIQEIKDNPDDPRFLKSEQSAQRKMWDTDVFFEARKIKDYLRFQIVADEMGDIITLRHSVLNSPQTTSYKDQFRNPCKEGGHRAFKFHVHVEASHGTIVAEGQIGHKALETLDVVKHLRLSERSLKETGNNDKLSLRATMAEAIGVAADIIGNTRRLLNHHVSESAGLDALLDPSSRLRIVSERAFLNPNSLPNKCAQTILGHSPSFNSALTFLQGSGANYTPTNN
jgi:hypothetical protein